MAVRDVVRRLPPWAVLLVALVFAVAVTAVVVVAYDRGILPLAGPFVLAGWMPLLVWARVAAIRTRTRRRRRSLAEKLGILARLVAAERNLPPAARASTASDRSLAEARPLVTTAAALLGEHRQDAVTVAARLAEVAARWQPGAPLTRAVQDVLEAARKLTLAWGEVREEQARR